jgi:hypothetical protein
MEIHERQARSSATHQSLNDNDYVTATVVKKGKGSYVA